MEQCTHPQGLPNNVYKVYLCLSRNSCRFARLNDERLGKNSYLLMRSNSWGLELSDTSDEREVIDYLQRIDAKLKNISTMVYLLVAAVVLMVFFVFLILVDRLQYH